MMKLEHKANLLVAKSSQCSVIELINFCAVDDKLSAVSLVERAKDVKQRRFAGARGTYDAYDFLFGDVQVDTLENFKFSKRFMDVCCLNHGVKWTETAKDQLFFFDVRFLDFVQ